MKKAIIISSSPRRGGNSDTLCDRFMQGAMEAGHHAEKIFLRDHKIEYCVACDYCADHPKCSQKDDMEKILEKLVEADVIVFATPVYFYSMDAQMKTFIDRTTPRYTELAGKDFYFILSAADDDVSHMQRTVEGLRGFTEDCIENSNEKGIIYALGVNERGEVVNTKAYRQAYEMGMNI